MDRIRRIRNPIMPYAWGSRTAIALLQGRPPPSADPEAELWMGAHPSAPSQVEVDGVEIPLDRWIARDPVAALGADVATRFDGRLPFLLKLLAAEEPLSIQAHPNLEQARAGFARENAAGVPLDAPDRSYRDANHKPELICALSPFTALNRFREPAEIRANLAALGAPELRPAVAALDASDPRAGLAACFETLMGLPGGSRERVVERAAARARPRGEDATQGWIAKLATAFPGDIGVLAPLYLNVVELAPGEAMFLPAGELHSYLHGVGVEIMANSDNVLRGGLTPKHVDLPELQATLSFRSGPVERLRPEPGSDGAAHYVTPADEFEFTRLEVADAAGARHIESVGPEILLAVAGRTTLAAAGETLPLDCGEAVFVSASVARYTVRGAATLVRAGVGRFALA